MNTICCGAVLAGAGWALVAAQADELRVGESRSVVLVDDDAVLEAHGPARVFSFVAQVTGSVHVWAASRELDPFLRIENPDGELVVHPRAVATSPSGSSAGTRSC